MKINVSQTLPEGLIVRGAIAAASLDIDSEVIKFQGPLSLTAQVCRITNTITVDLHLAAVIQANCIRCLEIFRIDLEKSLTFVYEFDPSNPVIDLAPQIREELIIDYPLKPLCKEDCKGLCHKCGGNLNEGGCSCS